MLRHTQHGYATHRSPGRTADSHLAADRGAWAELIEHDSVETDEREQPSRRSQPSRSGPGRSASSSAPCWPCPSCLLLAQFEMKALLGVAALAVVVVGLYLLRSDLRQLVRRDRVARSRRHRPQRPTPVVQLRRRSDRPSTGRSRLVPGGRSSAAVSRCSSWPGWAQASPGWRRCWAPRVWSPRSAASV